MGHSRPPMTCEPHRRQEAGWRELFRQRCGPALTQPKEKQREVRTEHGKCMSCVESYRSVRRAGTIRQYRISLASQVLHDGFRPGMNVHLVVNVLQVRSHCLETN